MMPIYKGSYVGDARSVWPHNCHQEPPIIYHLNERSYVGDGSSFLGPKLLVPRTAAVFQDLTCLEPPIIYHLNAHHI